MGRMPLPPAPTAPPISPAPQRRQEDSTAVTDYIHSGCFSDGDPGGRLLMGAASALSPLNPPICCSWCLGQDPGYTYCGVENGLECWCDVTVRSALTSLPGGGCNRVCNGDPNMLCGGQGGLALYRSSTLEPTAQDVAGYSYHGCYVDYSSDGRILLGTNTIVDPLNAQTCCSWCETAQPSHRFCGVEAGNQCRCDSTANAVDPVANSECNMPCGEDSLLQCGAMWRMNLYEATATPTTTGTSLPGPADTTPSSVPPDTPSPSHGKGLGGGAIAGIVIGSVAVLVIIAALWLTRKIWGRKNTPAPEQAPLQTNEGGSWSRSEMPVPPVEKWNQPSVPMYRPPSEMPATPLPGHTQMYHGAGH